MWLEFSVLCSINWVPIRVYFVLLIECIFFNLNADQLLTRLRLSFPSFIYFFSFGFCRNMLEGFLQRRVEFNCKVCNLSYKLRGGIVQSSPSVRSWTSS
jgi:hypothetical protein